MPYLTRQITKAGPLVEVEVGVAGPHAQALRNALQPVPAALSLRALLDTGADRTIVDYLRLQALGVSHLPAFAIVTNPFGPGTIFALQFNVSLTIRHPSANRRLNWVLNALPVIERQFSPSLGYEVIIGQDVLSRSFFVHDGQGGVFTLDY